MKIEIHCPYHGKTEEIELPDGYETFEGEIKCSDEGTAPGMTGFVGNYTLRIKLSRGAVMAVERARRAGGEGQS